MKNFIFKSTGADLQKMFQLFETRLDVISGNLLYVTHQVDFIRKKIIQLDTDKGLQKQVDEFYESEDDVQPEIDKEPD